VDKATLAVNIFQRSARRRNGWEKREGVGAQCIAPRHFDAWEIAGSGIVSETPWPQGAGVLPSFQLSLPCDRASSETKRTLSRPTLTVQDMTVGSAKSLPFRRLILLVATYARLQALLLSSQRREERFSCPGVHRLTVLWSLVRTSILLLSIAPNEASKERNAFHPLHKCQGLSSDLRCNGTTYSGYCFIGGGYQYCGYDACAGFHSGGRQSAE